MQTIPHELYPFDGHTLDRHGLRYHYLDEGSGEPVVMVHGNPSWSIYYRPLVEALRHDYRCIVPDHIGCGFSDIPDDQTYGYRLADRVADLTALVDQTCTDGVPITLVAHDWGGMIAMAYAARHPERIGRIVLLNTAAFHLPAHMKVPSPIAAIRNTPLGTLAVQGFNAFSRGTALIGCKRNPMSPALKRAYCAPYDTWQNRIATLRFVQDIPLSPADPSYELVSEVEQGLCKFSNTPALLCWGMRDFVFNGQVLEEFQKHWPHAEIERYEDCGHYVLEDASSEVTTRIRTFLAAHPLAPAT